MNEFFNHFILSCASLIAVLNPFGNVPLFVSLTEHMKTDTRQKLFKLIVYTGFTIIVVFSLIGDLMMTYLFRIDMKEIRMAGGIILIIAAIKNLLFSINEISFLSWNKVALNVTKLSTSPSINSKISNFSNLVFFEKFKISLFQDFKSCVKSGLFWCVEKIIYSLLQTEKALNLDFISSSAVLGEVILSWKGLQHFLYFLKEPQGQISFGENFKIEPYQEF